MQLFVRSLACKSLVCQASCSTSILELKHLVEVQSGIPSTSQGLVYSGKQLQDERTLSSYGITSDSTLHLVLRLRGGKGGFGALLRGQGRDGKITTNFDACRDLQGRRVRHQTAEKKLEEWQAQAKERELEQIALKHMKEVARQQKREDAEKVEVSGVVEAQRAAVQQVQDAVQSALAEAGPSALAGAKRPAALALEPKKKAKVMSALEELSDTDSDEE